MKTISAPNATPPAAAAEKLPAEVVLLRSGDEAEWLTLLGLTANGRLLCQCRCGVREEFTAATLADFLKPASRWRLQNRHRLRCGACRELNAKSRV